MTENDVVEAVAKHLTLNGYRVDRQLTTIEQGIDIEAVHLATGRRLLVEAKGGTSSKEATNRFGKPFSRNQARSHVSVALYCAARLRQEYGSESAKIALALPDDESHRSLVEKISESLRQLEIAVFLVAEDRTVNEF